MGGKGLLGFYIYRFNVHGNPVSNIGILSIIYPHLIDQETRLNFFCKCQTHNNVNHCTWKRISWCPAYCLFSSLAMINTQFSRKPATNIYCSKTKSAWRVSDGSSQLALHRACCLGVNFLPTLCLVKSHFLLVMPVIHLDKWKVLLVNLWRIYWAWYLACTYYIELCISLLTLYVLLILPTKFQKWNGSMFMKSLALCQSFASLLCWTTLT